jgi:hypothetical protein
MNVDKQKLYIAECDGKYKIGVSDNPPERIKQLSTGSPSLIELRYQFDCWNAKKSEKNLHDAFGAYRVRGEWFDIDEDVMDMLWELIELNGVDAVARGLKQCGGFVLYLLCYMQDTLNISMDARECGIITQIIPDFYSKKDGANTYKVSDFIGVKK